MKIKKTLVFTKEEIDALNIAYNVLDTYCYVNEECNKECFFYTNDKVCKLSTTLNFIKKIRENNGEIFVNKIEE